MFSIPTILLSLTLPFTALSLPSTHSSKPTELLYQFPNGTWVENIAVRSNNQILVTLFTTPDLYALDSAQPNTEPTLIHRFANATTLFGIAEIEPDVFAVIAGNFSLTAGTTPGSYAVWKVKFGSSYETKASVVDVSLIGPIPEAKALNGLCVLPKRPGEILVGDIDAGQIYRMDTRTGAYSIAIPATNDLVSVGPSSFGIVGVDGIHVRGDDLYVANVGKSFIAKLQINPDGSPARGARMEIVARARDGNGVDDFALDNKGNVFWVTSQGNSVAQVSPDGKQRIIAGNINSTEIAEPTSAALSREKKGKEGKKLFVVTGGGLFQPITTIDGPQIVGGQVVAIDLY
jgi:hypothetical protein